MGIGRLPLFPLPADASESRACAFDDYRTIGWCMRGLDEVEFLLLREVYGPAWFDMRRCGVEFGAVEILYGAVEVVKRRLKGIGMIPAQVDFPSGPGCSDAYPAELFRHRDFPVRWDFTEIPAKREVQHR
ncbi:MAG TPA: hypothetical protein VMT58_09260 [Candidatus Binataceae bacterium]|nr:hypothetical protein [Candidatus Binataceae bacterium]